MNIKVLGAGSIGNHISHAAINLNWNVDVFDVDETALKKNERRNIF